MEMTMMESMEPALPGQAVPAMSGERGQRPRCMKRTFIAVGSFIASTVFATVALAAEAGMGGNIEGAGIGLGGLVIGMGLASLGGALGQGKATAAALEGIARNPAAQTKIQTPMILGLALIESLVLLSFLIAFMAQGKIH